MEWLATAADAVLTPALKILLILVLAVLVRALTHKLIDRVTGATARGLLPTRWIPWAERLDANVMGATSVARRRERMDSLGSLLKSVSSFVIVVVTLILVLAELGINVAPILASAGIAGIAIGFGAQNLVRDFLAGITLILEDQFGVGDTVDLGSASGVVLAVSLRTTTLRGADGTIWYVRNGEITRVGNISQGEPIVDVDIPLPLGVDTKRAAEVILTAATQVADSAEFKDDVLSQPVLKGSPAMSFDNASIRVSASVRTGRQAEFARAVRIAVKEALDADHLLPS